VIKNNCYFILALCAISSTIVVGRSVHRTRDPLEPFIEVRYQTDDPKDTRRFTNRHLSKYPLTLFDKKIFDENLLPKKTITYRNSTKTFDGAILNNHIEGLLAEVLAGTKEFTHFEVLCRKDFNRHECCGLEIFKYKHGPIVVKLFIDTKEGFVNPWGKGFVPIFLFYMGGGTNRHLAGFTRVPNLHTIKAKINADPYWKTRVDTPRKWFWLPKNSTWLEITAHNVDDGQESFSTRIPAIYAIVADAIDAQRVFSATSQEDSSMSLAICHMLEMCIDPHITNFMVEKETGKIVIIDTEHFPTIVGLDVRRQFNNYAQWVMHLVEKCSKKMLFSTKGELRLTQHVNA
jgi:hypothetical protein